MIILISNDASHFRQIFLDFVYDYNYYMASVKIKEPKAIV